MQKEVIDSFVEDNMVIKLTNLEDFNKAMKILSLNRRDYLTGEKN